MASPQPKPVPQILQELWELLKAYAKQETVDPLRSLGRFLAWGLVGSILLTLGSGLVALGVLRLLQTQTGDVFFGAWSFVPYLIVVALLAMIAAAAMFAISREPRS